MENLINAVEELLEQKKSNLKYGKQELKGLQQLVKEDEETICKIECELTVLKQRGSLIS